MLSLFFLCAAAHLNPFQGDLEGDIEELVSQNPKQMSAQEYERITQTLLEKGPCNLLVFGTGRDSELYMRINAGGSTLFIEDSPEWIEYAKAHTPDIDIVAVTYKTRRSEFRKYLQLDHLHSLAMDLPKSVTERAWDMIIVDAPAGYDSNGPGRMQSIYTAALLAKGGCDVFVHDCNRTVEKLYTDHLFSRKDLVESYERTRHYQIK